MKPPRERPSGVVLCDQPGCDAPAVSITQAQGRNTPPKAWYGCDAHRPTPMTLPSAAPER